MIDVEFSVTVTHKHWEVITPCIAILREPESLSIGVGFLVFNVIITFHNESND